MKNASNPHVCLTLALFGLIFLGVAAQSATGINSPNFPGAYSAPTGLALFLCTLYGGRHLGGASLPIPGFGLLTRLTSITHRLTAMGMVLRIIIQEHTMQILATAGPIRPLTNLNPDFEPEITHLPFVLDTRKNARHFWNVKPTGDYPNDCLIGRYYAVEALQFLRRDRSPSLLGHIVGDMPKGKFSGIEIGFLSVIAEEAMWPMEVMA